MVGCFGFRGKNRKGQQSPLAEMEEYICGLSRQNYQLRDIVQLSSGVAARSFRGSVQSSTAGK